MKQANISLVQAMQKATQAINGKPIYDIEIAKGTQIYDLIVDSTTGQVIISQLDSDY